MKGFTAESRARFDRIQKDVVTLEADAARLHEIEARDSEARSFSRSPRPEVGRTGSSLPLEERKNQLNAAFRSYARHGYSGLNAEQRDLLTTSDATGGALIPQEFLGVLVDAKKFYGPIADKVAQRVTNHGRPMKVSIGNDTANGITLVATEGSSGPAETDPAFLSRLLSTDTVSGGLVKVSFEELEDSAFDVESFLRTYFAKRFGRGLEVAVTKGTDSSGTVLPNQTTGGLLGTATVGSTTASLAAGIGWTDLVGAYGALDAAYATNASWVFNTNTRATLLGMKDGFGRPFWTPDPSADGPFEKLLGLPVVLNQAMPNYGANATPILLGDLSSAYLLRTDGAPSILRLNERYADTLEVGFYLYSRIGGISLAAPGAPSPLVSIKQAAS